MSSACSSFRGRVRSTPKIRLPILSLEPSGAVDVSSPKKRFKLSSMSAVVSKFINDQSLCLDTLINELLLVVVSLPAVLLVCQGHRSRWPHDNVSNVDLDGLRHCIDHSFGHIIGVAEQLFGFLL